ncbi:putative transcriptional corepressor cyc8 [Phaeomoniella chlamydospora]|uniref:Putative transcriptional corepressor cyc8 n=1 Tax=Phaeomoniella chlamydospora TaxID=158046 RepID=A0A0G2EXW3_PHACM|nr:putative transcriptional corepressor cyc8 [Phaeomoniella chlamydospora]
MLVQLNESVWISIGNVTELMGDLDGAVSAYEQALRHNAWSIPAMNAVSCILRTREQFPKAIEYLQNILKLDPNNGEVWGSLGHCHLMMDNLQDAYSAYQQALYYLRDPKEPKLWYGIGILYDRYGSLEHAEEAFSQVMRMQPDFEKANEIYFRLGIIYKQQQKFNQSLECFKYIVTDPPRPLTQEDIWFQIGHVHEQQKDYEAAKAAYGRVLEREPKHAKVLQQLGWLHHQQSGSFSSQEQAINYLEQSVSADNTDAQSWYLLGRCYMAQQKFPKAYEAYQQAVYRDGRNPTFWCSIGVLYYQINQYRDALDAYSRAIRLNPYISEVWYDLGTLYESCNNQTADALDAYTRAADLDPTNMHIKARLQLLKSGQGSNNQQSAPVPQDVHPQAYQSAGVGAPPGPQWGMPQSHQGPPPQGGPQGPATDWTRGLSDIRNPQAAPAPPNPFDQRDSMRAPPPRHPSPRQELGRPYQEPPRGSAPPPRRTSPSPKMQPGAPTGYPGPQGLPQVNGPDRGAPAFNAVGRPQALPNAGPPPPAPGNGPQPGGALPPYGRPFSPITELRPLREERPQSPGGGFQQQYHPPPFNQQSNIASGAPAPASALAAAEEAARQRDERPPSAMKRLREWESDTGPVKKIANEETRARLDDHMSRRASPPLRAPSPRPVHRRGSEELRREEQQRRANENYHPSEAAHHPPGPALPSIQHLPPMHQQSEPMKEERKDPIEPAARKVDVDDNYDDDGEDDKRSAAPGVHSSPRNGVVNGQPKQEVATA